MSYPQVKLGDLCEVISGGTPRRSVNAYWNGQIPWVKISDMDAREISETVEQITAEGLHESSAKLLNAGTVLFSIFASIGKVSVLQVEAATNQAIVGVVPRDTNTISPDYLGIALEYVAAKLQRQARGVAQSNINISILREALIPLPCMAEQKRIAEILDKAYELKAKRQQAIDELDKLQQSVFLDMFGDPVTNAKRWIDTEELCDHAMISSGITKGRRLREAEVTPVPYLAVSNVQDQRIVLENVKTIEATSEEIARYALEKGDILLTEGGDPDKLGRGAIWEGQIDPCIHQNHVFKVRLNSTVLRREFLSALLSSARGKRYFLRGAKQTTGIASINMSQLKKFPLLIPPLELQDRYVAFLDQLSSQRQIFQTQSAEMEILFKSLQQRAFSGDL